MERYDTYIGYNVSACNVVFAVENMDYSIRTFKENKVAGPDSLTTEHFQHAGDELQVLLTKLLKSI